MSSGIPDSRAALVLALRREGVKDERVLAAMGKVRREMFVPSDLRHAAYADTPLSIGEGQSISQPYIVAVMTAALGLAGQSRVLEVGTGSGYQTALLAELAGRVISIERNSVLAERASRRLLALSYHTISVLVGDGTVGWASEAPYDAIIVTAGSPAVPATLLAQLADGGRIVLPVGTLDHQSLRLITRHGAEYTPDDLGPCRFVPLVGQEGWKEDLFS